MPPAALRENKIKKRIYQEVIINTGKFQVTFTNKKQLKIHLLLEKMQMFSISIFFSVKQDLKADASPWLNA